MIDTNMVAERAQARRDLPLGLGQRLGMDALPLWGVVGLLVILIVYPLAMLLLRSLQEEDLSAFTLANYAGIFANTRLAGAMLNSLTVSIGVTVLATIFGVSLAWINARTNTPGARILGSLNLVPYLTSPFIGAIAWSFLAARNNGLFNKLGAEWFGFTEPIVNIYSPLGIIWVLALFDAPVVYLFTIGAFRKMDPSLEESARVSGSGLLETTFRVTLPLAIPSIAAAALLVFVTAMGAFEVPLALGLPGRFTVMTTELYAITNEYPVRYNLATATSSLLLLVTAIGLLLQRRVILRRDYITVTGKGYRPSQVDIGRFKYLALGWNIFYLLVAVALPMFALLAVSLQSVWTGSLDVSALTLKNYAYVLDWDVARRSLVNSLFLATAGATVGMIIGTVAAYFVFRTRLPGRAALDMLTALPIAVPGVILAIGVLVGWIRSPIYGTIWIMIVAYVARFIPYAQRSVAATLLTISSELDECSRISGASWWSTMRNVVLPLLKPGIMAGWILLFIIFLRELGMSLFLYRTGTETMSVALFLLQKNSTTATAAFALLQTLLLLGAIVLFRRVARESELVR